jgi:uncharacterized membrane protein
MLLLSKFLHLAGAIIWLGGMVFMLVSLRPVAIAQMQPSARLTLLSSVMSRFFVLVWASVVVLLLTGLYMMMTTGMAAAPKGWHWMLGIGLLMFAIFGHLYYGPFKRLKRAVARADWARASVHMAKIHTLVVTNFCLGWAAVAAVVFVS